MELEDVLRYYTCFGVGLVLMQIHLDARDIGGVRRVRLISTSVLFGGSLLWLLRYLGVCHVK